MQRFEMTRRKDKIFCSFCGKFIKTDKKRMEFENEERKKGYYKYLTDYCKKCAESK